MNVINIFQRQKNTGFTENEAGLMTLRNAMMVGISQ